MYSRNQFTHNSFRGTYDKKNQVISSIHMHMKVLCVKIPIKLNCFIDYYDICFRNITLTKHTDK